MRMNLNEVCKFHTVYLYNLMDTQQLCASNDTQANVHEYFLLHIQYINMYCVLFEYLLRGANI